MTDIIQAGSYNGLSWGIGTAYRVQAATGFEDLANLRRRATPKSLADGVWHGKYRLDEHMYQLTLAVVPLAGVSVDTSIRALVEATPRTPMPGNLIFDNGAKQIAVSVVNRAITRYVTPRDTGEMARAVIQWEAADPKVYSYPAGVNTSDFGSSLTVNNVGNDSGKFIVTITGSVTNPVVTLASTGQFVRIPIATSSTIVMDFGGLFCTNGGVRTPESPASDWFLIPPGSQTLQFSADSHSGTSVSVEWASAWS